MLGSVRSEAAPNENGIVVFWTRRAATCDECREDRRFVAAFADAIRHRYPGCAADIAEAIALRACARSSGRVGRTAAATALSEEAIDLAVRAHLRHRHTPYDELLMRGRDRHEAREAVRAKVDELMAGWLSPGTGSGAHA